MGTTHGTEALTGTVKNGQVILDSPVRWPEGNRFVVMRESLAEPLGAGGRRAGDDVTFSSEPIAAVRRESDAAPEPQP